MIGIHRNLGVHISKVKSVSLDGWATDLVKGMKEMGDNEAANAIYEEFMPEGRKPTEDTSTHAAEAFIREKYEKKLFMKENQKKSKKKSKKVVSESEEEEEAPKKPSKQSSRKKPTVNSSSESEDSPPPARKSDKKKPIKVESEEEDDFPAFKSSAKETKTKPMVCLVT